VIDIEKGSKKKKFEEDVSSNSFIHHEESPVKPIKKESRKKK